MTMKKDRRQPLLTRKCALESCTEIFKTRNSKKKFHSLACYRIANAELMRNHRAEKAKQGIKTVQAPRVKIRKAKGLSDKEITRLDKEQLLLNRMIDQRHSLNLDVKIYKRGEPGFDEVAATITPLHLIKKGVFTERSVLGNSFIKSAALMPERRERELRL